jgi:iron(III) transport system substrate-binding protein
MKVRTTRMWTAMALMITMGMVAGCGASPTDTGGANASGGSAIGGNLQAVYAAVQGLTGQQRQDKLIELAKQAGGTIGWYHSGNFDNIVKKFTDATGIKVKDFQATSERVAERVNQERQANQQGSDVILGGTTDLLELDKQGGLVNGLQTVGKDYVDDRFKNDFSVSPIAIMEMPTRNTSKIPANRLPRTWEDLFANPPGRIGIEITDWEWYEVIVRKYFMQQKGMTEQQAIDLITHGLRGAQQVDGHTLVANLLASGQYDYVPDMFAHYVPDLQRSGAPISYDGLSPDMPPMVVTLNAGLTAGGHNPAGGLLLIEYLMGKDGQQAIADRDYVPTSNQYVGETLLKKYPNAIVQDLYLTDTPQDRQAWQAKFDHLLQQIGGTPISK